jgi:hypothetical protein
MQGAGGGGVAETLHCNNEFQVLKLTRGSVTSSRQSAISGLSRRQEQAIAVERKRSLVLFAAMRGTL